MKRRTRTLVILAVITLAIDSALLVPPVSEKRRQRRDSDTVEARLFGRSDKLERSQSKANADREAISDVFDALDSTLNLVSRPNGTGLKEAQALFPELEPLQREARLATTRLPLSDAAIVREAKAGRQDITSLLGVYENEADLRYLKALDGALLSLIETQEEYAKLTAQVGDGFKLYEVLFERTGKFLKDYAAGTYRNAKEASQVYVLATGDLIEPLVKLRTELDEIEVRAAARAEVTSRAFMKAAALRQARN